MYLLLSFLYKAYGIPEQLCNAIEDTYSGTKAKVISPDGETKVFEITAGVLQGDTLAPYLFIIVLDYVMRVAISGHEEQCGFKLEERRGSRSPAKFITDLDFAEDIALIAEQVT